MHRSLAIFIVMAALLVGVAPHTQAQESSLQWHWATTPDGLLAYTLDGTTRLVIEDPLLYGRILFGTSLSAESMMFFDEGSRQFYVASTESAVASAPLDTQIEFPTAMAYQYPYILFVDAEAFAEAGILNVETLEVSLLNGFVMRSSGAWAFVEGGLLRYFSYSQPKLGSEVPTQLRERDLATGSDIELLGFEDSAFAVYHSLDGEQWWLGGTFNRATGLMEGIVTYGEVNPAVTAALATPLTWIAHDWVISQDVLCTGACPFTVMPITGDTPRAYTLASPQATPPQIVAVVPDGTLILLQGSEFVYRLDADGTLDALGFIEPYMIAPLSQMALQGGWWLLVLGDAGDADDSTRTYRLWDMTTGEIVHEAPVDPADNYFFGRYGPDSAVLEIGQRREFYFDGAVYDLSRYRSEAHLFPLQNGQVRLQANGRGDLPLGIHVYDVLTDTMTLVVPDGLLIHLVSLVAPDAGGSRLIPHKM